MLAPGGVTKNSAGAFPPVQEKEREGFFSKLVQRALQCRGECEGRGGPFPGRARHWQKAQARLRQSRIYARQEAKGQMSSDLNAFSQSVCIILLPLPGKLTVCQQAL